MSSKHASNQIAIRPARLWMPVRLAGAIFFAGTAALIGRLIWEETVWTWRQGPQMVGFSLAHGSGALLLVFPVLLAAWTAAVLIATLWTLVRKRRVAWPRWAALGLIAALFGLGIVPEGFWQRLFIRQMARSPHASDLLATAGCNGDVKTIESYLTHGVPVNATSRGDRKNALHCASFLGHLDAIRYLASHGASLDTLDRAGDSALEMAASNGQEAAVKLLQQLGAHRVRGTGEQREKAIQDQVSEQIAEDEKRMQEILKQ